MGSGKVQERPGRRAIGTLWKPSRSCLGPGEDCWSLAECRRHAEGQEEKPSLSALGSHVCCPHRPNWVIKAGTLWEHVGSWAHS